MWAEALHSDLLILFQPLSVFHFMSTSMEMFAEQTNLVLVYTLLAEANATRDLITLVNQNI